MQLKFAHVSMIILGSMALTGAGAGGAMLSHRKSGEDTERWVTARVERGGIRQSISSTGKVVANLDVEIKCKASGEVIRLPFDVSDPVRKGELLLQVDPVDAQRDVKQAEAALASSRARLAISRQNLTLAERALVTERQHAESAIVEARAKAERARTHADRLKQTMLKNVTSHEEYEAAEADAVQSQAAFDNSRVRLQELQDQQDALELKRQDILLSESDVAQSSVNLDAARERLEETRIAAPIDGVVSARNVQAGQIISSAVTNVGGGTTVLTLSDLSRIFVLASIDESDIGKVRIGQDALISADSFGDARFAGKVVRIATKGVNVSNVVTFEVKLEVVSANAALLKPEMTANIELAVAQRDGALKIPTDAVMREGQTRRARVLLAGGAIDEREIETGICDGATIEVLNGLADGDRVIVSHAEPESRWNGSGDGNLVTPTRLLNAARK